MLVPLTLVVPVTESVGVELPEKVIPLTVVGVIFPATIVKAGVVPPDDEPENPLAVAIETAVTVPLVAFPFNFSIAVKIESAVVMVPVVEEYPAKVFPVTVVLAIVVAP